MGEWNFWEMIVRATIIFFVLLLLTRLMGKKQISQMTFFNYITGIALGTIAGGIASDAEESFLDGFTSLIWWAILAIVIGYIDLKSEKVRTMTEGKPLTIIKQGKVLEQNLGHLRLTMEDLSMLLREQKVFGIGDVETAVFEKNGQLSIQLK